MIRESLKISYCSDVEKSSVLIILEIFPFLMLSHKTVFIKNGVQYTLVSGEDGLFLQCVDSGCRILFALKDLSYEIKLSLS